MGAGGGEGGRPNALQTALGGRLAARRVAASNPALAAIFTDAQLFWVAAAQTHCGLRTAGNLAAKVRDGPHPPERFRVLGPFSQSPAFATAFECRVESAYRPVTKGCTLFGK